MSTEREEPTEIQVSRNPITRGLWLSLGLSFVALGSVGIVIPGLPTTPFMLLAAACFARSSERFYSWVITNPIFGAQVVRYRAGHGLRPSIKLLGSTLASLFIGYAVLFGIPSERTGLRALVAAIGVFGVWFILSRPTDRGED